ncbi:MAG: cyclic nucleotide-binding domain-containing protein [Pseudomonadota bacterium]
MTLDRVASLLASIPLFSSLDLAKIKLLVLASDRVQFDSGQILCKQGDYGDAAFVILDGDVRVFVSHDASSMEVARLKSGSIVGEFSLLYGGERLATVEAASDVVDTLKISKDDFLTMMRDFPEMTVVVLEHMARSLSEAQEALASTRQELDDLKVKAGHG